MSQDKIVYTTKRIQGLRTIVEREGKLIARCFDISSGNWNEFEVTFDQAERIKQWCETRMLVQQALPDLDADQRELLMFGINSEDWDNMFLEDNS